MSRLNKIKRHIKHRRINRRQKQLHNFSKFRLSQETFIHRISIAAIIGILFLIFLVTGLINL
jgi:hypothetical protein